MIDNLVGDVQLLWKAECLIGKIWVNVMARRLGLFAFAGLLAVLGLGMANMAGFLGLQTYWGPVWAATAVAIADFALAGIVIALGRSAAPGPEMELAVEVRNMAIASLEADTAEARVTLESLGNEIRQTRDTLAGFARHPFESAAEKLLIPAVLSIIRGLSSKKGNS